MGRVILHCDCNSFFASVEAALNPALKDVPMAVCGSAEERRGIVLAKNELAKKYGIKTAETVWSAKKKCPTLITVEPHHEEYSKFSKRVNEIYLRYTDMVEPFGIDESWLDVTASQKLFGAGIEIAERIRQGQIEVLIAEIKKLGDLPTIVTGDFNVSPEASAYTTMIGAGFLDSSRVAKEGEIKSTYNGMDDSYTGAIIDYIFVSPDLGGVVDTYTVCPAKRDGQWISDHNAIIATITLPKPEAE